MPASTATAKIYLRTDRPKKDGTFPVYLRLTAHRKKRYTATGVSVEPKHWNERKSRVRASHPIADALNARLDEIEAEAKTAALGATSADAVKAAVGGATGSLTTFFQSFVDGLDADGKLWEHRKYKTTLTKLRGALGQSLTWAEVDVDALRRFERYLRLVKENGPNMVRKEMTRLRRVFKQAIREGVIEPSADPFVIYQKPKAKPVHRRKLEMSEIEKLRDADLDPASVTGLARDVFVFAFYVGGMRFGDVCSLRADAVKDGRATYAMMKTRTMVAVPVPAPALAIFERQRILAEAPLAFPLIKPVDLSDPVRLRRRVNARNAQLNVSLKRAAAVAEIDSESLSMHVARHSYADFARRKSGDLFAISKTLGHKDLATTEAYLKSFDQDAVDKLGNDLWS